MDSILVADLLPYRTHSKRTAKKAIGMAPLLNVDSPISAKRIMFSSPDFYLRLSYRQSHSHKDSHRPVLLVLVVPRVLLQVFRRRGHLPLGNTVPRLHLQDSPMLVSLGKVLDLVLLQECLLHRPALVNTEDEIQGFGALRGIALHSVWYNAWQNEISTV